MTEFITLFTIALILSAIKVVNTPFKIIETFFHELSHGLVAILTFGKIHNIKINIDGSGLCETSGGIRLFILLAGYLGSAAFGLLIYYTGTQVVTNQAENFLYGFLVALIFVTISWVRDLKTLFCMFMIITIFYFPLKHELFQYTSMFLKFIGIYTCLNALKSPLILLQSSDGGDGNALFKITFIPSFIWVLGWFCFGLYCFYNIYELSLQYATMKELA